eukprot:SAG31_NODE_11933_length_984_cov_1.297175_2_plen_173_part_00
MNNNTGICTRGGDAITIGWLAFQDMRIKQKLIDAQYFGTACPSRASELQAIMALRASNTILEKNMRIIRKNVGLLSNFVYRFGEFFEWVAPRAGAIAYIRFKGPLTAEELGDELAKAGISIKPAYCFLDDVDTDNDGFFRVGFGESIMPAALDALIRFVEQHEDEWKVKSRL